MMDENPYSSSFDHLGTSFNSARHAPTPSWLAAVSLLFGLASVPLICLCFVSIPLAVIAIVTGHMARFVVSSSGGRISGSGMATCGAICGYLTLLMIGTLFFIGIMSEDAPLAVQPAPAPAPTTGRPTAANPGQVLFEQAEIRLLTETEQSAIGTSTGEQSATTLAAHYVETLHVVDEMHFSETNPDAIVEPRPYRVFVQLNSDSAAFLLFVPDYVRFTDAARHTLHESGWLVAQRSVDGILNSGDTLAVAFYSDQGRRHAILGTVQPGTTIKVDQTTSDVSDSQLAELFRLPQRPAAAPIPNTAELESQIDNRPVEESRSLPAERE
ncbi:MAG: DUF4190 domain-containing protein [Planctomycetaceae bacterium]